ncbi:jg17297, partial [Pararge aegeria aegeria]
IQFGYRLDSYNRNAFKKAPKKMVGYRQEDSLTPSQKLIAGSISGVVTRFVTQPLDVLKVRTQLQKKTTESKSLTLYGISKKMLLEEGITAFWHGHILGQSTISHWASVVDYGLNPFSLREETRAL